MTSQFSSVIDELIGKDATKQISNLMNKFNMSPELEADIYENNSNLIIFIDIPGTDKKDIKLDIVNHDTLAIKAPKYRNFTRSIAESMFQSNDYAVIAEDRMVGTRTKSIKLPESIDTSTIKATFENGVLCVSIMKKPSQNYHRQSVPIL